MEVSNVNSEMIFFDQVKSLQMQQRPFAIATVIAVRGSASAKPGSKALINEHGKNICGWVGGGCAESFVARNAVEAMNDGATRIIQADLDDEIFGLGMPCGGVMDVFIEPHRAPEVLRLPKDVKLEDAYRHLGEAMGFQTKFDESVTRRYAHVPALEGLLLNLAASIAEGRGAEMQSLREVKGVYREEASQPAPWSGELEILILGSSRITEELAQLAAIAKRPVRVYGWSLDASLYPKTAELEANDPGFTNLRVKPGSAVVVASHHKGDHEFIERSLKSEAFYVGLVASQKRSGLVFQHLREKGLSDDLLKRIYAPSGLDIGCKTPREIALSCLAEIIKMQRGF